MLRQQRNRFRTTQRNNRRSPVRGKDRGTWSIRTYAKGEIPRAGRLGPGRARPVTGPKLHPSDPTSPFIPLRRLQPALPTDVRSKPRDKDELKAACATFAIERATSHVTFRESLIYFSYARCAGLILTWKHTRARSLALARVRRCSREVPWNFSWASCFRIAELILNYLLVDRLFHFTTRLIYFPS